MKQKFMKVVTAFLMVASMGMFSCSNDPDIPSNEIINKDHEDPVKAELILVEGHLHGTYKFHQNPEIEGVVHLNKIQKVTIEHTEKGWHPSAESAKQFNVRSTPHDAKGQNVYALWIKYYNAKGEEVTGEFVENGQDQIHQHFFIPRDIKNTFDGVSENDDTNPATLFEYFYCDTDPWDKNRHNEGAKLIGDKNPIGLKGYFKFLKPRKQFVLNIELMHAAKSKWDAKGQASPFYAPSLAQRQRDHWDLKIKIPVVVYADQMEYLETEAIEDLSESDKKLLESIAKAYSITPEEALEDLKTLFYGDIDPEAGSIWL